MPVEQEFDEAIPVATIQEHPKNPRRGDDRAVRESIDNNGWFGAILVHRKSGNIIAGNTRYRVLVAEGRDTIPGFWVDCDDETATKILLADNRTSDLAYYDDRDLLELLKNLNEESGLEGTGYDRAAYDLLLQSVEAEAIVGGIRQGMSLDDRQEAYTELDIRSIILPYEAETYEKVATGLSALRAAMSLDTNADVIEALVDKAISELG